MYDKICPKCGTKLSQFYRTYMLGCPNCYVAFSEQLTPVLKELHGADFHVGKKPKVVGVEKELLFEYERLIKMREQAILEGDFSNLNEITAEIVSLSEELKRRGLI